METEFEATFPDIKKDKIREELKERGAELIKPEFLQKRVAFDLPQEKNAPERWVRVRDEKDKITMSFKSVKDGNIEDQNEINLKIDNFEKGVEFLEEITGKRKAYQENKRELWELDEVEICIDEWPFLEPFVEIEGSSEPAVKKTAKKLDFDYSKACFCAVGRLYTKKYDLYEEVINSKVPKVVFDMENPFKK